MRRYGVNPLSAKAASKLDSKVQSEINNLPYAFDESAFNTTFDEGNIITSRRRAQRAAEDAARNTLRGKNSSGVDVDLKTLGAERKTLNSDIETNKTTRTAKTIPLEGPRYVN